MPVFQRGRSLLTAEVFLEPYTDTGCAAYFAALDAADRHGVQPLTDIWRDRLVHAEMPEN